MTLEDFEKELASKKALEELETQKKDHRKHHHGHRSSRHDRDGKERRHHHRERRSKEDSSEQSHRRHKRPRTDDNTRVSDGRSSQLDGMYKESNTTTADTNGHRESWKRDAWMEAPSASDVTYSRRGDRSQALAQSQFHKEGSTGDLRTQSPDNGDVAIPSKDIGQNGEFDYTFGDEGSKWRMTKLKAVYSQAEETGKSVDDLALERYGSLQAFDAAREEQTELDRRATYGEGYFGKDRPSGELFHDRKPSARQASGSNSEDPQGGSEPQQQIVLNEEPAAKAVHLDHTALNRLKAQVMKAKLKGSPDLADLEADYATGMAALTNRKEPNIVVLSGMDNRMLVGRRPQEVQSRPPLGKEKGGAGDDGEMTIEDMMREERRTKGQAGGESRRFAERIAKDAKFDVSSGSPR